VNKRVNIHVLHPVHLAIQAPAVYQHPRRPQIGSKGGGRGGGGRGLMKQCQKRAFHKPEELNRCKESLEGHEVVRKAWTTW
jgi:hypothetical protein